MRQRALVHVAGPQGAGKTTLIERLLRADLALAICVRAERDAKLRKEHEAAPRAHPELRRYRDAGATAVALYAFPEVDLDTFYMSDVMQDYSEAVYIEGDLPIEYVDLAVFVAPSLPRGRSLLERVTREHAAAHRASIEGFERALVSPESLRKLVGGGVLGESFAALRRRSPQAYEEFRRSFAAKLEEFRQAPPPPPTEHWALHDGYQGIENAQLVIVNVRDGDNREAAEALLGELARLRKDPDVFRDVLGLRGHKVPITAVAANLMDARDTGLRKAIGRVKRAIRQNVSVRLTPS